MLIRGGPGGINPNDRIAMPISSATSEAIRPRRCNVQKARACDNGHHRTCTLPVMYFFGTSPQSRLSELLLR